MQPHDNTLSIDLIEAGIDQMRRADRWRLAALASFALNIALAGWVWSWWVAP